MTEGGAKPVLERPKVFPRIGNPDRRQRLKATSRGQLLKTVGERMIRAVLVIFLVTFGAVALLHLAPGSAAGAILGEEATPERIKELSHALGFDKSLWLQYTDWAWNALQGNLGTSPITGVNVVTAIYDRLPVTLEIAVLALIIALAVSIPLATAAAAKPGSLIDRMVNGLSSVFLAVPAFVAGPILILILAVQAGLFPVSGWVHIDEDFFGNLQSAFLPALAVGLTETAVFMRLLRADLVSTLREDYIAAARAKGMSSLYVMFRHVLRPSSFSLMTVAGLSLGRLLGGTVIVEVLFGLPGLGQLISQAIFGRDLITVQGVVAFIAVVYVVVNTLVDIGYGFLDPRVRKAARA